MSSKFPPVTEGLRYKFSVRLRRTVSTGVTPFYEAIKIDKPEWHWPRISQKRPAP